MKKPVVIIGTLDTKGAEIRYLKGRLEQLGLATLTVDSSLLGEPLEIQPDITAAEAASSAGYVIDVLRSASSRGEAVRYMQEGLKVLMSTLYESGRLGAVVCLGGAEGAVMGASAVAGLPLGVPKVIVSPIASGKHYFAPLVGTRDVMVVHSVVDILGLNPISRTIFDNVAASLKGMMEHGHELPDPQPDARYVGVTMLGNTTRAVMAMKALLESDGYEPIIFHSNGVGGPAMEEMVEAGLFSAVIDFTTNEIYDPLVGGIHDGGPNRLQAAGRRGLPQIVVPGCVDFGVFRVDAVPAKLAGRPVYLNNPEYAMVRANAEEMCAVARLMAERIVDAQGPIVVVLPTQGLSIPNTPGGPFWDPETDAEFRRSLTELIEASRPDIPIRRYEMHVNDPAFGRAVAEEFRRLMTEFDDARTSQTQYVT